MVSLGSLPRLRWGRSTRVEGGIDCGEREGEETAMFGAAEPKEGEYCGFAGGINSLFGKDHSVFIPDKDLRSCCPEMRAEPAYMCA